MYALKGQQPLAQGNALGLRLVSFIRPERAKALKELRKILELLPLLRASIVANDKTQGVALDYLLLPLRVALFRLEVCYFDFI